ncbi:MAG TPA: hypothetical protein PK800_09515, partial [Syntrophorhabdaceae bacterium]|nr:hypothetical protein [Syntrophorhabdaceae bacterium]
EIYRKGGIKGLKNGGASGTEKKRKFKGKNGNASAGDIKALIDRIKKEVFDKFGVDLVEEVELWGFEKEKDI